MPRLHGNQLEFTLRVEPGLYRELADRKDPKIPFSTYCTSVLADSIGYKMGL